LKLENYTGTIQWQDSTDGVNFANIDLATGATYSKSLTKTTWFRAVVTQGSDVKYSTTVEVVVNSSIGGTASTEKPLLATLESATIALEEHDGEIIWQMSSGGETNYNDLDPSKTSSRFETEPFTEPGKYYFKAKVTKGGCPAAYSNSVEIVVEQAPAPGSISADLTEICAGGTVTLTSKDHGGEIQWQSSSTSDGGFTDIPGAKTTPYTVSSINSDTWYRTKVTGTNPDLHSYTEPVSVRIKTAEKPELSGQTAYCNKVSSKIEVTPATLRPVWSISPLESGTIDQTGTVTWSNTYTGTVKIKATVSNGCGTGSESDSLEAEVTGTPIVRYIQGDSLVCRGRAITYQVTPEAGVTYNWEATINTSMEKDDSKGMAKVTYLDQIPNEGVTLKVTPQSSCSEGISVSKLIMKGSDCDLFVPNILTPETSDGFSVWQLEGIQNFPQLSVDIFNRWGDKVYSKTGGYDKPWDGTTQGKPLPTATYYYVIDKQDGSAKITGSVTVVRD
jgi:gliding motility-associated-like protein